MASRVAYIRDKKRNPAKMAKDIRALASTYADRVQKIYQEEVVGTWAHQADFPVNELTEDGGLIFNVGPAGDGESVDIFRYVDEGTDVRYARMSLDFVPKTQVGQLRSGQGRGGFEELDFLHRPGIQAREYGKQIVEQLQDEFTQDIKRILNG